MVKAARCVMLVVCQLACAPAAVEAPPGQATAPDAGSTPDAGPPADATAQRLMQHLNGRFDSADQAATQAAYHPVQLQTCVVAAPVLGNRVLYVEQALMGSLAQPYRQRLYVIESTEEAATARSRVFEFRQPSAWVGTCAQANPAVAAEEVEERAGCDVVMAWDGLGFSGGTSGEACASTLQGASYATSEVSIQQDQMRSWDRGFDAQGTQVWGATQGPYLFQRRTPMQQ